MFANEGQSDHSMSLWSTVIPSRCILEAVVLSKIKPQRTVSLRRTKGTLYCITLGFCMSVGVSLIRCSPNRLCFLSVLHLLADLIAEDLVPVNLGAGDRELSAQSFERGVRHGLVVLTDGHLKDKQTWTQFEFWVTTDPTFLDLSRHFAFLMYTWYSCSTSLMIFTSAFAVWLSFCQKKNAFVDKLNWVNWCQHKSAYTACD